MVRAVGFKWTCLPNKEAIFLEPKSMVTSKVRFFLENFSSVNIFLSIVYLFQEESEDLRDRMMTMEAELRALREELSHRGSSVSSSEEPRETNKDKEQSNASTPEPKPMKKLLHERQMSMELEVNGNADSAKPRTNGTLGSSGDQTTSEEEESSGDDLMQPEKRLSIQDEDLENKTDVKKTPKQSDDQDEKSGPADQEQEPEQAKTWSANTVSPCPPRMEIHVWEKKNLQFLNQQLILTQFLARNPLVKVSKSQPLPFLTDSFFSKWKFGPSLTGI